MSSHQSSSIRVPCRCLSHSCQKKLVSRSTYFAHRKLDRELVFGTPKQDDIGTASSTVDASRATAATSRDEGASGADSDTSPDCEVDIEMVAADGSGADSDPDLEFDIPDDTEVVDPPVDDSDAFDGFRCLFSNCSR
jgi:hypothetical protein